MNPLDLPVHPALVHFPLAMLIAAWACVLLRHGRRAPLWDDRVRLFETIGVITLPFVIVAGFVDLRGFGAVLDPRWSQPLIWHLLAGIATTALFTTHWVWRRGRDVAAGSAAAVDVGLSTAAAWTPTSGSAAGAATTPTPGTSTASGAAAPDVSPTPSAGAEQEATGLGTADQDELAVPAAPGSLEDLLGRPPAHWPAASGVRPCRTRLDAR